MAEIRACLAEEFAEETIQAVIDRLIAQKLIDDARLVRNLVEANRGKKAISINELRRRCAARSASPAALALLAEADEPPIDSLLARFERTERGRVRAYRFLTSRGFGEDDIAAALERFPINPA